VDITFDDKSPTSLTVFGAARSYSQHKNTFKSVEIVFNKATKLIDVTIFEDRRDVAVPLHLRFQYKPSAPIHEIAEAHNIRSSIGSCSTEITRELPDIDIHETFTGPEVTINAKTIERFCTVVGSEDSSFQSARNSEVKAPMDFAIVAGWQVSGSSMFILS
jgi:fatty acid synthase subunit alpha, fungi type